MSSDFGLSTLPRCVIGLVKAIVGAGILGLPFAFGQTGLTLGTALLALSALLQSFTCHLLLRCITAQRGQCAAPYSSPLLTRTTHPSPLLTHGFASVVRRSSTAVT